MRGTRAFFARHNLDIREFRTRGLPEEILLSTGDAMARRVVEVAHGR